MRRPDTDVNLPMNVYTTTFYATCPVNGKWIEYRLRIEHSQMIRVEELIDSLPRDGFHEDIADNLFARFGGVQTLTAEHHGVHIATSRSA